MNNLLVRELTEIIEGQKSKVLSVFLVGASTNRDEFDGAISKVLSESNLFDRLHVIGRLSQVVAVAAWLGVDEDSGVRLRTVFRNFEAEVCFIVFDEKAGEYRTLNARLDPLLANSHQIISSEKRASLFHAFETSSGMMIAPDGFHYAKTSGAHSTSFIRASNVLELSENVSLMAFWMLSEIWKQEVDQVIVDTSGIYAPALLATQMRALLRPGEKSLPVWSHQSFRGLEDIGHISSTTLCFISASTSGTLANLLVKMGASKEKVWTLFGLSQAGWSKDNTYCDLLEDPLHFEGGYKAIENQMQAACRYCKSGSLPVALSGDQFVLEPPTLLEIDLLTTDIPDQMRVNLSEMMGMGLFKVHRVRKGRKTGRHEIYLDVDALFRSLGVGADEQPSKANSVSEFWQKFIKAWKTLQSRAATFNVERLVFLAHSGSEQLVKMVNNQFPVSANLRPKQIAQGELSSQPMGTEASGTVVVSSFFEDQQELMMVKRDLRDVQPFGTIWFISPFLRGTTKDAPDHFRRLIGYGEFGQGTFSLHHCHLVILPECQAQNAWDIELQTLGEIKDWLLRSSAEIPPDLVARATLLRASASLGLEEDLFWTGPAGQKLKLRHDFTLAPTHKKVSQADIFCVISSFLHQLRGGAAGKRRLIYTPFARSVIAPSVFTKFNDGVLQASILRAARGHELHYASSPDKASVDMLSILRTEVDEIKTGRGEALMEFVLAIIAGRLTLDQKHVLVFGQSLQRANIPDSLRAASQFMMHIFNE